MISEFNKLLKESTFLALDQKSKGEFGSNFMTFRSFCIDMA